MDLIDSTTVASLFSTVAILGAAWTASLYALPKSSTTKMRVLFVWHAFDALIHFCLEGSYLYNCFFSYIETGVTKGLGHNGGGLSEFLPPNVFFLGRTDRLYGSFYGTNPFSALWRVYAQADKRWGGSDLTVISLELLTVFVMAPIAVWVCICLSTRKPGTRGGSEWFWMMIIATGELYGGESRHVLVDSSLVRASMPLPPRKRRSFHFQTRGSTADIISTNSSADVRTAAVGKIMEPLQRGSRAVGTNLGGGPLQYSGNR